MEAAVLLPVLMLLFALLMEPVCLLYTRMVMGHAAAGTLRVLATNEDEHVAREYALRRLEAVPEVGPFHVGGSSDWAVRVSGPAEEGIARVSIAGHARPLPLLAAAARALGCGDGWNVELVVEMEERVRPAWVRGDYDDWVSSW